jgi:glutamate-ammonia-ligase adenylyltransferase
LKKSNGGISEVELVVRYWQLRHVAAHPDLKRGAVFRALDVLDKHGLAEPEQCQNLREAYGALRRILNRIRMMDGGTGSKLPEDPEARAQLSARLGIDGDLLECVDEHRRKVHAIYEETYAQLLREL